MKISHISLLLLISLNCFGKTDLSTKKATSPSTEKKYSTKSQKKLPFFSSSAAISMADGTQKAISNVKIGEEVVAYKDGKATSTTVKEINIYDLPVSALTTVYLRPMGTDQSIVPALVLEATPHHKVTTSKGLKRMKKLSKNDILYHYDAATGELSSWKVGAVKTNSYKVRRAYDLKTEDGTFFVANVMVANN